MVCRDLLEHGLEPLLELAPVLGARDERAHVQGEHGLVLQALGHVALDDALGQAFGDGRLADARLADEDRVVLGPAAEDADDAADLGVAADDRVELAGARLFHQVAAVFLERVVGGLGIVRGHALLAAHVGQGGQDLVPVQAELAVDAAHAGCAGLVHEGEEDVLHRDEFVLHPLGAVGGGHQDLLEALGDHDLVGPRARSGDAGQLGDLGVNRAHIGVRGHAELLQYLGHEALFLRREGAQEVFAIYLLVPAPDGQVLGLGDGALGFLGKSVRIHMMSSSIRVAEAPRSPFPILRHAPAGPPRWTRS